jgi:hypothetical protein
MANGWTPERQRRQSEAIHRWKPWEQSTGPKTLEGKAKVSMNSYRGGKREKERALFRAIKQAIHDMSDFGLYEHLIE